MNLARLVFYSSNVTQPSQVSQTVQAIVRECSAPGLTGTLLFDERYFLYAVEGPRTALSARLGEMFIDARQRDVTLLSLTYVSERRFPSWLLAFAAPTPEFQELFIRFGSTPSFDPPALSPENANGLLQELWRSESRYISRRPPSAGRAEVSGRAAPAEARPEVGLDSPSTGRQPAATHGNPAMHGSRRSPRVRGF
ncbi:BLUF domain-containing protein [Prosthecomicrobium hirschii]|uniref:BLUF domain-containing protein n=1 Tax=Prosthecodimorpha hirschii TaxID=665126 RepID=UPI0009F96FF5|nr:BLUF domain-containing protein [Prosthecomicrobium hirschii]